MSRSLGVLTLDLIAKTGNFDQGMDRASRRVRTTANEMEAARRAADRMVAGIAAAAAGFATAAAAMAVSSAKALDATSKMAQQIGTTTESLTGMRFAAQQFANISDQQFDMSMRRMTRRIAEAAEGSGSAKAALEAMGLSAKELARLSPDRQMLAIADAMQRTERQADRLRYTMALFDTEGMALVPALQQGAEAFEANIALAKQFGVVVSQEAATAAEEFMTNMNLLTEAQKGFKNQVAESVLPALAEFTGYLVELSKNAGEMSDRVETALKVIGVAAAGTATIITSRLIASIAKKTAAWTTATVAAARHQAQMVSLSTAIAGANRVVMASAATAAAAATTLGRAGQLLLGVLGGGWGLAATAAITGAAFLAMGRDSKTAATDVDELTRSLENLNRRQLESAAFNLENELVELSKQAEGHGQILRGLHRDYDALAKTQDKNSEGMRNARQSIREEEEAFESVIATIAKKSPLLAQITQRLWDLDTASRGAAGGVDTLNRAMGFSEAGEKYLAQIQGRIKALQDSGDPIKIASRYIAEHTELTEADRVAIMSAAHAEKALIAARDAAAKATKSGSNALNEAKRAAEAFRREQDQGLRAQLQAVSAIHQQAGALEDQVLLFGQSKTALEDLTIARLEEQAAMLRGFDGSQEQVEAIEREIEARRRLRTAIGSLEQKEAEKAAWESWSRDVEQIFQQVGQSLTDAIFDGGRSARDLVKDLFKTLTLRVLIQPVMGGLQGLFMGAGPAGIANAGSAASGMMGSPTSLFSMFGGNSMGMGISNVMSGLSTSSMLAGTGVGNWMTGVAGNVAGMSNLALGGAGLLGGLGANLIFGGKGHSGIGGGLGSTVGMALGGPIGAVAGTLIGGGLGSLFGDREPTTRREQRTQVEYAGGLFDVTKVDDRAPAGADAAARALAEQAVSTANDIFRQVGVDAAVESFHAIMASSYQGDRDGVASGGRLRIGDKYRQFGIANEGNPTIQGFGGWSSAETLPRLAIDVSMSLMEALQAAGVMAHRLDGLDIRGMAEDQVTALATTIQQVVQEIAGFDAVIGQLPFENLRNLSFEARDGLLMLTGGFEGFMTAQASYTQNFYSESERAQMTWDALGRSLGEVGLAVPQTRAEFRALVDAQDANTEAGRRAIAMLLGVESAFASVTLSADELAEASRRAAADIARERLGLETQLLQLQGNTAELRRRELAGLDASNRGLQAVIWARQDHAESIADLGTAYQNAMQAGQAEIARLQQSFAGTDSAMSAYRSQVQRLESEFGALMTTITRGVADLRGQVDATAQMQYAQARAVISTALATGQLPQTADLSEAIRVAQQGVTGNVYARSIDQERAYTRLANEMEALTGIAQPELDTAQATLAELERHYNRLRGIETVAGDSLMTLAEQARIALSTEEAARHQISVVEQQLDVARQEYEELTGIRSSLDTGFANLLAAFQAQAQAVQSGGGAAGGAALDPYYTQKLAQLQQTGSMHDGIDWSQASTSDLAAYFAGIGMTPIDHWYAYGRHEGLARPSVPGFASGGVHAGGWRIVGERGPELEATGPARIYNAGQTTDILRHLQGGGRSDPEIKALLREVVNRLERLERPANRSARASEQLAEQFDQVTEGANAIRGVIMEPIPA